MPIKTIKTDLEWGDVFFLKVEPEQNEYHLVGLVHLPGSQLQFILSRMGEDEIRVYDFECSKERDEVKRLKNQRDDDDNEGDIT